MKARLTFFALVLPFVVPWGPTDLTGAPVPPKPPPLATDGTKLFVSRGVELTFTNAADQSSSKRIRPTKDNVENPFYDEPLALHVPFQVRHEGGPVHVVWHLRVTWDNPPAEWSSGRGIYSTDYGIYRTDGRRMGSSVIRGRGTMSWEDKVPLPTATSMFRYTNGNVSSATYSIKAEDEPHQAFSGERDWVLLQPAEPGSYVLWLSMPHLFNWPAKENTRDKIVATVHADIVVARGDREPGSDIIAYLFGRGPRPAEMLDDKFYRASTTSLLITFRRNAWQFDHAEVRVIDEEREKLEKKRIPIGNRFLREYQAQPPAVSGKDVRLALLEKVFEGPRAEADLNQDSGWDTVHLDQANWTVTFPHDVPDNGLAILTLAGSRQKSFQQKPDYPLASPIATYFWDFHYPNKLKDERGVEQRVGDFISRVLDPDDGTPLTGTDLASYKKRFLEEYGQDAAQWFVPYWYEWVGNGPKKGEPPFRYVIRGSPPHATYWPLKPPVGSYPLLVYQVGPWYVIGYYKRLNEIESRYVPPTPDSGPPTIVSDADLYWKWFPELVRLIGEQRMVADRAVAEAALEAIPLQNLLRTKQRLMLDRQETLPAAGVIESGARALDDNFPKLGIGTLPGGSDPGSVNTPVTQSPAAQVHKQALLKKTLTEINQRRNQIAVFTAQAQGAYEKILQKLDEGQDKFGGPGHPQLYLFRLQYRQVYERIPFDIAIASKDPAVIRKALAEAESKANSTRTRLLEAQLYSSQGDNIGALYALRSAVRTDPKDALAAQALADLECAFLKTAIDKSQGTIRDARAAFYGYMLERGIADNVIKATGDWPFARAASWSTSAIKSVADDVWAVFTTGLFGSFSAFAGKPAAEADLLATTERQMTTAFVGLHTMLRLRARGYNFDAITRMTSTQIRDTLPLRDLRGNLYSDAEARLHAVAVREAMKLPDVQALVADDRIGLELGVKKAYWNSKDVGDTWLEWIGDVTSMYNLFLMLPGAKVGMSGRAGLFWGQAELEMMQSLEQMGKVVSGTEAVANTVGLTRMLGAAGATDSGRKLVELSRQLGRYQETLAWYDKAVWTAGKITGLLTINCATVLATEKLAGHKAAMLMTAALMFGSDFELLGKLLDSRNIPRGKVAALILNEYLPATQVHIKRLVQIEKTSFELEELFERVKAGRPLSAEDFVFLNKHFESDWRKLIPNGHPGQGASIALTAAAEGARTGVNNGAAEAAQELLPQVKLEAAEVVKAAEEAKVLAQNLQAAPPVRGPPPPSRPPSMPRNVQRVLLETRRGPTAASYPGRAKYPLPPVAQEFSECAAAADLLRKGKYREAQEKYEEIIERILKGELQEANEIPLEFLHLKRCLAYELQTAVKKRPQGPSTVSALIPEHEVEEVLGNPAWWQKNSKQGAFGNVYTVQGKDHIMVKEVPREMTIMADGKPVKKFIDVAADVENTMVHDELARALGFETPGTTVKLVYDANGEIEKAIYIMRRVEGKPLSELSAAEIYLFKEELSRHRALAVAINDYDRHIGNYLVTPDGRLVPIDAGVADVLGKRALAGRADHPLIMEGAWGRDHYYSRHFKDEICSELGDAAPQIEVWAPHETFHRKGLLAEESLNYLDAKPTIDALDRLVQNSDDLAARMRRVYEGVYKNESVIQQRVNAVVELKKRGKHPIDLVEIRKNVLEEIEAEVAEKVKATVSTLEAREGSLNQVMKGLDRRHVVPRRASLTPSDSIVPRLVLGVFDVVLDKAA